MARKSSYNYSLPLEHKVRVYIPIIGLEVPGRLFVILFLLLAGILIGGGTFLFSRVIDTGQALLLSSLLTFPILTIMVAYQTDNKGEEGSNPMMIWYNKNIKHYRMIVTDTGVTKKLSGRTGVEILCIERSSKRWKKISG